MTYRTKITIKAKGKFTSMAYVAIISSYQMSSYVNESYFCIKLSSNLYFIVTRFFFPILPLPNLTQIPKSGHRLIKRIFSPKSIYVRYFILETCIVDWISMSQIHECH